MKYVTIVVAAGLFLGTTATADPFDECRLAVSAQDRNAARLAVDKIVRGAGLVVEERHHETVSACLVLGRDQPYAFSKLTRRFKPLPRAQEDNLEYANQQSRLAAQRERMLEEERGRNELQAQLDRDEAARRRVMVKLQEACVASYRNDPYPTIMNALCFESFLKNGLPE